MALVGMSEPLCDYNRNLTLKVGINCFLKCFLNQRDPLVKLDISLVRCVFPVSPSHTAWHPDTITSHLCSLSVVS